MDFKKVMTRRVIGIPLGVFLIIFASRIFIIGTMAVGRTAFPTADIPGSWMVEEDHPFRDYLANFDGAWFIRVAAIGYEKLHSGDYDWREENKRLRVLDERGYLEGKAGFGYRHFPTFPYMIRAVQPVFKDWVLTGLLVANLFSFIFLIYLFYLTEDEFGTTAA